MYVKPDKQFTILARLFEATADLKTNTKQQNLYLVKPIIFVVSNFQGCQKKTILWVCKFVMKYFIPRLVSEILVECFIEM